MNRIDAMIAPRALTALELVSVIVPNLIVYGVAYRAFIHNQTLSDGTELEAAVVSFSESALDGIRSDALGSVSDWLGDMEAESEPRFYRKGAVKDAVDALCNAAADQFIRADDDKAVHALAMRLTDRDRPVLQMLIDACGVTAG